MTKPTKRYKMISVEKEDFETFDKLSREKKKNKVSLFPLMLEFFIDNYDVATHQKKVRSGKLNLTKDEREIQKMIRKEISLVIGFIKQQDKYMYIYRNEILWKIDNNSEDVMHPMQMHFIIVYEYLIMIVEHFGIKRDEIDQWIRQNISVSDALQFQESVHLSETMNYFK